MLKTPKGKARIANKIKAIKKAFKKYAKSE